MLVTMTAVHVIYIYIWLLWFFPMVIMYAGSSFPGAPVTVFFGLIESPKAVNCASAASMLKLFLCKVCSNFNIHLQAITKKLYGGMLSPVVLIRICSMFTTVQGVICSCGQMSFVSLSSWPTPSWQHFCKLLFIAMKASWVPKLRCTKELIHSVVSQLTPA